MTDEPSRAEGGGLARPDSSRDDAPLADPLAEPITRNIENVAALYRQETQSLTASLRRLDRASRFVGRPLYLVGLVSFVALWISINTMAAALHYQPFDGPPFPWLQGLLTLVALITTTTVLIAQNRQTKLEQQRAHLDLQINLLTEQKVTKLIHLIEELRRDLPMVRDREDPQATQMQKGADAAQVASALEDVGLTAKASSER